MRIKVHFKKSTAFTYIKIPTKTKSSFCGSPRHTTCVSHWHSYSLIHVDVSLWNGYSSQWKYTSFRLLLNNQSIGPTLDNHLWLLNSSISSIEFRINFYIVNCSINWFNNWALSMTIILRSWTIIWNNSTICENI